MELKIEEIASALFLTKEASKVYIELLTHTQLTQEEIKKFLKFSDSQLKISLELLLQKGFICQAEKNIFKLSSLFQIEEKIEHDKKVLYNLQRYILPKAQQKDLSIVKYEGIEGVRKVYLEVLEEAKATGETILAYESGLDAITIGSLFVNNYIEQRIRYNIEAKVICPDNLQDKRYKDEFSGKYTKIKLLTNFVIKSNMNIVGDLVMTFTVNPPRGTLRRDPSEAITQKSIFDNLWQSLKD